MSELSAIYDFRFNALQNARRSVVWRALCEEFFPTYIRSDDVVLDLGAGDGLFITQVHAGRRIAVDMNPAVVNLREMGVETIESSITDFRDALGDSVDVIFMSNVLEHLPEKRQIYTVLRECWTALRPGGRILIIQPNIRYTGAAYWDYIDHHIALTDRAIVEALQTSCFEVFKLIPRFLPYTAKSAFSRFSFFAKYYLRLPLLWRVFGKQSFIAARKRNEGGFFQEDIRCL